MATDLPVRNNLFKFIVRFKPSYEKEVYPRKNTKWSTLSHESNNQKAFNSYSKANEETNSPQNYDLERRTFQ